MFHKLSLQERRRIPDGSGCQASCVVCVSEANVTLFLDPGEWASASVAELFHKDQNPVNAISDYSKISQKLYQCQLRYLSMPISSKLFVIVFWMKVQNVRRSICAPMFHKRSESSQCDIRLFRSEFSQCESDCSQYVTDYLPTYSCKPRRGIQLVLQLPLPAE